MATTHGVRREATRGEHARRGLVVLVAAVLLLSVVWLHSSGRIDRPTYVHAQLADAGGSLAHGADVKINGVIVGRVAHVRAGPDGGVRVDLDIAQERLERIPPDVVARILPATVFGTSYVDLTTHGRHSEGSLQPGAVVPADRTQGTLELQQALDDIDALVKALGPAELASAIGSAAQALDGRGEQLGSTIDTLNRYLGKLGPRLPQLREDLRKLSANLELADDIAPDLLQATRDALVTARTLVDDKDQLDRLLREGILLAGSSQRFLDANAEQLVRFLDNAVALLEAVYDNRYSGITRAFETNRLLHAKIRSVIEHGFARTLIRLDLDPPPAYTSADCPRYGSARGTACDGLGRAASAWMWAGNR